MAKKKRQMVVEEDSEEEVAPVTMFEEDSDDDEEEQVGKVQLFSDDDDDDDDEDDGIVDDEISSDDDDEAEEGDEDEGLSGAFGEDDDDSGDDDELPIERKSRLLDKKAAAEAEADEAELARIDEENAMQDVDADEDEDGDLGLGPLNLQRVKDRMHETARLLENFKELIKLKGDSAKPRSEYREMLVNDLAAFYGYIPYLTEKFLDMFSPSQTIEFLEANEAERPVTIRTNTLKTRRKELIASLQARGMRLEAMDKWSKVGLVVYHSSVPVGATPEYLAGHYMIQSASSFLPCISLNAQPGERILDLCAAPGGKTSYLAGMMKNTGVIFANDKRKDRLRALNANVHRLGVRNCVTTAYDGRQYPKVMTGFDRCLLDAPCTGLGVISKDPSVKMQRDEKEILALAHLQRELLMAAVDCVDADAKSGGIVVYSTCSVAVEENEAVVDFILKNRHVKLVSCNLQFGVPGFVRWKQHRFHPSLALTRRFYPHTHNMDGFFVACLQKTSNNPKANQSELNHGTMTKKAKAKAKAKREGTYDELYGKKKPAAEQEESGDEDEDEDDEGQDSDVAPEEYEGRAMLKERVKAEKAARKGKRGGAADRAVAEEQERQLAKPVKAKKKKKRKAAAVAAADAMDVVEEASQDAAPDTSDWAAKPKKKKLKAKATPSKKPAAAAEEEVAEAAPAKKAKATPGKKKKAKATPSKKAAAAAAADMDVEEAGAEGAASSAASSATPKSARTKKKGGAVAKSPAMPPKSAKKKAALSDTPKAKAKATVPKSKATPKGKKKKRPSLKVVENED